MSLQIRQKLASLGRIFAFDAPSPTGCQERSLTAPLLEQDQAGDLWIGDRNFSTRALLVGWHERGCGFIVREHGAWPNPQACGAPVRKAGSRPARWSSSQ